MVDGALSASGWHTVGDVRVGVVVSARRGGSGFVLSFVRQNVSHDHVLVTEDCLSAPTRIRFRSTSGFVVVCPVPGLPRPLGPIDNPLVLSPGQYVVDCVEFFVSETPQKGDIPVALQHMLMDLETRHGLRFLRADHQFINDLAVSWPPTAIDVSVRYTERGAPSSISGHLAGRPLVGDVRVDEVQVPSWLLLNDVH